MKHYVYGFKNRLLGVYECPVADIVDGKDYIEKLSVSLSGTSPEVLSRYKEFDVYKLGEFDSKTGELKSCCDFVESLEPICLSILNGKNNESGRKDA